MTSFFEKLILVGALMVNICMGYDGCLLRNVIEYDMTKDNSLKFNTL